MFTKYMNLFYILIIFFNAVIAQHSMTIKDVKCLAVDKSFCRFEECGFSTTQTGQKTFNLVLRLLKLPVTNCILSIEFKMQALTLPVTFNATYDACKFMENRKKNRALMRIYDTFAQYMNINHSCPYNHDIFFKCSKEFPVTIPIPRPGAEYAFKTIWIIDKKIRLKVDGSLEFTKRSHPMGK